MKCKNCGAEIPEDDLFCGKCGTRIEEISENAESLGEKEKKENTQLWIILSAIEIFLCCSIPGIVSLVYSVNANSAESAGREEEAKKNIEKAQIWFLVGIAFGFLNILISTT